MNQYNKAEIKSMLLKNKNLAMVLYVLSQIPSYTQELTAELNIHKSKVEKAIRFLKEKRLIRVLDIKSAQNGAIRNLYPLILKKLNKIQSTLPSDKAKSVLKNLKFYYISKTLLNPTTHRISYRHLASPPNHTYF